MQAFSPYKIIVHRVSVLLMLSSGVDAYAQTGPAGVGDPTTNILWLSADQGVTLDQGVSVWADRSGNANHAGQLTVLERPQWEENAINGYPALVFDNDQTTPDYLRIADNPTLEGMSGMTAFAVFELFSGTPTGAPRGIFSKRNSPSSQNAYGWFLWNHSSNLAQHLDIDGTTNRISAGNHAMNTVYLNSFTFDGSNPISSQEQVLYMNGTAVANGSESSTVVPNYTSHFSIGRLYGHTGTGANATRFNGRIAEIVLYNRALNSTERTIVQNYLSAKYGTSLSSMDLYTMDDPVNGDFDHDVAGIGRMLSGDAHSEAQGSGIVAIGNAQQMDDGEFLMWGHDNGMLGAWGVDDRPADVQGRLQRVWRVSETTVAGSPCDVGAVDITFDLTSLGAVNEDDLRFLADEDGDGLFADEDLIAGATDQGAGRYRFSGVTALQHGTRFTLATTNIQATPLPVELVHFDGKCTAPNTAELRWTTASEQQNARFILERGNGLEWSVIAELPGLASSSSLRHYSHFDTQAPTGLVYYRLSQQDVDGTIAPLGTVPVWIDAPSEVVVYPNPSAGTLWFSANGPIDGYSISDMQGKIHLQGSVSADTGPIDVRELPPGTYLIHLQNGSTTRSQRLIVLPDR